MDEFRSGPIDDGDWPETIAAHAVDVDTEPHLFGYAVETDLANHYCLSEILLLAATGELPEPGAARAFELGLAFLAPASIAEAPVHAACLSRICGAEPTATLGVAAIALGEQARFVIAEHADLLGWLENGGCFPERHVATSDSERASVARLRNALAQIPFHVDALDRDPTRTAALLGVLWAAGLRDRERLALAWILSRLPVAAAEARHHRPGSLRDYPMNTPIFSYQPPGGRR